MAHLYTCSVMAIALHEIPNLMTGSALEKQQSAQSDVAWSLEELGGRLVEIRSVGPAASLVFAVRLVLDAQRRHEPVVWICALDSCFFPADVARNGVELDELPVVRMAGAQKAAVAADKLVRSGAFGLIVMDLGEDPWFADALQKRLAHHAEEHHTTILCLTEERRDSRTLGSLVSLRAEVTRSDERHCVLRVTRDKRRRPGWSIVEECHGTVGMR